MKSLIIFYSHDGNTRHIADAIKEEIDADILELKPKKEVTHGFGKHFWGGKQVVMKETPELEPFDLRPNDYDLIFIGTPIWAFNFSPPLRTFFSENKIFGKNIALFCCHGGMPGKTFKNMKDALARRDKAQMNYFLGEADFNEPLSADKEGSIKRAKVWARNIVENLAK